LPVQRLSTDALSLSGNAQLHQQLYVSLRQQLLSGHWPAAAFLPSERQLSADLQLSRSTVQQALQQLVAEGYLVPQHGRGYRIVEALPDGFFAASSSAALPTVSLPTQDYGLTVKAPVYSGYLQPGVANSFRFGYGSNYCSAMLIDLHYVTWPIRWVIQRCARH
jgi:GntR family transcriptional regulator/MocR family aminotransferase